MSPKREKRTTFGDIMDIFALVADLADLADVAETADTADVACMPTFGVIIMHRRMCCLSSRNSAFCRVICADVDNCSSSCRHAIVGLFKCVCGHSTRLASCAYARRKQKHRRMCVCAPFGVLSAKSATSATSATFSGWQINGR